MIHMRTVLETLWVEKTSDALALRKQNTSVRGLANSRKQLLAQSQRMPTPSRKPAIYISLTLAGAHR